MGEIARASQGLSSASRTGVAERVWETAFPGSVAEAGKRLGLAIVDDTQASADH